MQDYTQLKVWQEAHEMTLATYQLTRAFPKEELYGLTSQVRRSAASVPANIAEGCGRNAPGDLVRFLQIASGSASETQYHLLLAKDLGYIGNEDHREADTRIARIRKMLAKLAAKVAGTSPTDNR